MANKYKISRQKTAHTNKTSHEVYEQNKPLIGKVKILLVLILGTLLAAGIYITAMKMQYIFIFHIYWIVTALLFCLFIFLSMRNDYLFQKSLSINKHLTKYTDSEFRKRTKVIKYVLLALLPFLFTVMGDAIYLLIIKDSQIFESIVEIFCTK